MSAADRQHLQAEPCAATTEPPPLPESLDDLVDKFNRLYQDFVGLERWAMENRDGNAFADQVAQYAAARLAEWEQPLEEWEP